MKTKLLTTICHLALAMCALAQTTTLTINNSTGEINVPLGITPYFDALIVAGTPVPLSATPQQYGAIGDGTSHPLSGPYATLAAAQAAFPITVAACTYSNASTTVTCADATFLAAGYPISGTGIPSGATVSSVTDSTHFVLSATPTASGSSVSLTSSFITSLTQERDYAGMQQCVWLNGSMYLPAGKYLTGSTLKVKSPSHPTGVTITGAGEQMSEIIVTGAVDGVRLMQGYPLLQNFAIQYVNGNGGRGSGIILDTGAPESEPPRYTWNWHIDRVYIKGFAQGIYNPYKWDEGSVSRCDFYFCGAAYKTIGNLDTTKITASDVTGLGESGTVTLTSVTTNGTAVITCASTTNILPGMVVRGTDLPDNSAVVSVDSPTQLTLNQIATGSHSGLTMKAYTVGLWVDSDGRAIWSSGVFGSLGYAAYGSGNGGVLMIVEDLHIESTSEYYYNVPTNGTMHVTRNFHAVAPSQYDAWVEGGANFIVNGMGLTVFVNGRSTVRATGAITAVDVNWNNFYHYAAQPWHTADFDAVPGSNWWPAAAASAEGTLISQPAVSGTYRTKLWQCVRTGAATWAWQVINGAATSDDIVTLAHGGTGTATPNLTAGSGITITGTWPNQTIAGSGATTLGSYDNSAPAYTNNTFVDVTGGSVTVSQTGTYRVDILFSIFNQDGGFSWQYAGTGVGEANHRAIFDIAGVGVGQINDILVGDAIAPWGSNTRLFHYVGNVHVTTAGTFKLQASQQTTTGNATFVIEVSQVWTKIQ